MEFKMKQLLLVSALSVSLIASPVLFAAPKPEKCPSVAALQSVKFEVTDDANGVWAAGVLRNNFDTQDTWTFVMDGLKVKSSEEALATANAALPGLSFKEGPVEIKDFNIWLCEYATQEGYETFAYTPAFQGNENLSLLRLRK
jgi:hypothetical protein